MHEGSLRSGDQSTEKRGRKFVLSYGSLRVPLDGENEVIGIGALKRLDHGIFGAAGDNSQAVAGQIR